MAIELGQRLHSIKHLSFCELPNMNCLICGEKVSNKVGYYVARKDHVSYWCCVEHGYKDEATNIKGTDAWTLAIMVGRLQRDLKEYEGGYEDEE